MSLAIFGLLLLGGCVAAAWKHTRGMAAVLLGLMLGIVVAGSHGPFHDVAGGLVDSLRSGLNSFGTAIFHGGKS